MTTTADVTAADASARLTDLQERVRNGDNTITAADLDAARRDLEYARLTDEAAQRAAEQNATEARHASYRDLATRADELLGIDLGPLVEAYQHALTATRRLAEAAAAHERAQHELIRSAREASGLAADHGETGALAAAGIDQVSSHGFTLIRGDGSRARVERTLPMHTAAAPLAQILTDERNANGWTFPTELWPVCEQAAAALKMLTPTDH